MSGSTKPTHRVRGGGFVLLEVMAAVVLLAILLVPLVTSALTALGAAGTVRERDGDLAVVAAGSGSGEAWEWGARVDSAVWGPGPVLDLAVTSPAGSDCIVGLWVNGWFVGEYPPAENGTFSVGTLEWRDAAGNQLLVRARQADGVWGPPWRSIIPTRAGEMPSVIVVDRVPRSSSGTAAGDGTVAHVPALANPVVGVGGAGASVETDPLGLVLILGPPRAARFDLAVGSDAAEDHVQSWYAEGGRALDVYF